MGFLVEKPQFDVSKLTPGTPIHIKHNRGTAGDSWYNFNGNCLVLEATPLEITVVCVKKNVELMGGDVRYERELKTLGIDKVADTTMKLTRLIPEVEPEAVAEGK